MRGNGYISMSVQRIYIYPQKLCHFATGKRFDIFPKLFLQWVGIHEESSPLHGRCSVGVIRGVAGPRPFLKTLIIYKITTRKRLNTFAWFFLHWVSISLNYFWNFYRAWRSNQSITGRIRATPTFLAHFFSNFLLKNGSMFLHDCFGMFCIKSVL